jgi:RNA polymerase sigma-70 factor (ECF subfamily)
MATDEELVRQIHASDTEAFRLLFEKYQPMLFRHVVYMLRDVDTAHDVVQESFVRLWEHRTTLHPQVPILAYLFRVSGNLVRDLARHREVRRKHEAHPPPVSPVPDGDPADALHLRMLEEMLADVVRTRLPERCRQVFLLSRVEGMSNNEISERLGIAVKTVENQITRALRILRRHLKDFERL